MPASLVALPWRLLLLWLGVASLYKPRTAAAAQEQSLTNAELLNALDVILEDVLADSSQHSNNVENNDGGLLWKNLSVQTSKGETLVHDCTGFVPNGALCAILGPSGSGKTSFLSALGARSQHILGGEVVYSMTRSALDTEDSDDFVITSPDQSQVAWVSQQDNFFSQLSSRETLQLAAFLELPHWKKSERDDLVQIQLESLGLLNVADNMIGADDDSAIPTFAGGASHRLSGGEKRRLTVALELLTHELFLLADEPTSGLDASLTVTVMRLIQLQAKQRQIPALCSLHQPRSSVWHNSIDYVLVMAPGGHVCYCGSRKDCLPYFEALGFPCPELTNPAEFLVDLVSIGDARDCNPEKDRERIQFLAQAFAVYQSKRWKDPSFAKAMHETKLNGGGRETSSLSRKRPFFQLAGHARLMTTRFAALFRRSWRQNIRSNALHLFRFLASAGNAILLSKIFPSVVPGSPPLAGSVADRVALLSFGAINMAFIAFMKAVTIFSEERPVIHREQTRQQYSPLEYLAAKICAELPLDSFFAAVFTTVLKLCSGLCISWGKVTATFSLMTVASASLGFFISSWSPPSGSLAVTASVPILVVLMVVGIINPSGVDLNNPPPAMVRALKTVSPFRFAIEALALGEYTGMEFHHEGDRGLFRNIRNLPKMGAMAMVRNGEQVLEALGLQQQTYANAMRELALLSVKFWGMSWLGLQVQQLWSRRGPKRAKQSQVTTAEPSDGGGQLLEKRHIETIEDTPPNSGSSSQPLVKVPTVRRI